MHVSYKIVFAIVWSCCIAILTSSETSSTLVASKSSDYKEKQRIGLLITATGRYIHMANKLIESGQDYFCTNHNVTYFVFTDGEPVRADNVVKVSHKQLGWPYDTMMRFHAYRKAKEELSNMDYLYSCDADMLFVGEVGDEILGERVAVRHSQLMFKRGFYDTNPLSTAHVNRHEGADYFVGAFYGGTKKEFFALLDTICKNIETDLARGVIARIHDESHLNRYFIDNKPTIVLSPSYCHFEKWSSPYRKKLIAFDQPEHNTYKVRKQASIAPIDFYQTIVAGTF